MRIILAVIGTGVAVEAVRLFNPAVTNRSLLIVELFLNTRVPPTA